MAQHMSLHIIIPARMPHTCIPNEGIRGWGRLREQRNKGGTKRISEGPDNTTERGRDEGVREGGNRLGVCGNLDRGASGWKSVRGENVYDWWWITYTTYTNTPTTISNTINGIIIAAQWGCRLIP